MGNGLPGKHEDMNSIQQNTRVKSHVLERWPRVWTTIALAGIPDFPISLCRRLSFF